MILNEVQALQLLQLLTVMIAIAVKRIAMMIPQDKILLERLSADNLILHDVPKDHLYVFMDQIRRVAVNEDMKAKDKGCLYCAASKG